jgi:hypothetical protein
VLVDLQHDNATEAHESIAVGTTFAAVRAPDNGLERAVGGTEGRVLQSLVKREIDRALPAILGAVPRAAPAAAK